MTVRFQSYSDAADFLNRFICYEKSPPPKYCGKTHYELARFVKLLERVGRPEQKINTIHIAGTDGKGSTAAFLAKILHSMGFKTGLYTSPHLFDYRERIQINGEKIQKGIFKTKLSLLAGQIKEISRQQQEDLNYFATVFELLTAMAFLHFQEQQVDWAVIETGLGGRLDATNVVLPAFSIITPIDREHTHLLGRKLSMIAREKAGIIKAGRPVFVSRQKKPAMEVIRDQASKTGSPLFLRTEMFPVRNISPHPEGYYFSIPVREGISKRIKCPLLGKHQVQNLAMALLAAQYILDGCPKEPMLPSRKLVENLEEHLENFQWPCRSELYEINQNHLLLDSAHSVQGANSLRTILDDLFPGKKVHHLLAFSGDKEIEKFLSRLLGPEDTFSFHRSDHPRSMSLDSFLEKLPENFRKSFKRNFDWKETVLKKTSKHGLYCAGGSLFWAALVRNEIEKMNKS
jgi:dihydrofolate synthase / folylpolyglutamate synthase